MMHCLRKGKHYKKTTLAGAKSNDRGRQVIDNKALSHNSIKCYRCGGIIGHVKRNHTIKFSKANVASENDEREQKKEELKWEQYFSVVASTPALALSNHANLKEEWITDSGYYHHVMRNGSLFLELHQHYGNQVITTADNSTYPVEKEDVVEIGLDDSKLVKLDKVCHVPGLKRNLISVSQITSSESMFYLVQMMQKYLIT